jgi:hypothetical protein
MSSNETYSQTQSQFVACPKCGFMNYAGFTSCERCQEGFASAAPGSASHCAPSSKTKFGLLNLADTFFMVTMLFGLYYYYFDHGGVKTESQSQFRLALLMIGSFGVLATGALKFFKKRNG